MSHRASDADCYRNGSSTPTARRAIVDSQALAEESSLETDSAYLDVRAAEVYVWRADQLQRAGYSAEVAGELAEDTAVDLHRACDLLLRGCPEQTAYAILV